MVPGCPVRRSVVPLASLGPLQGQAGIPLGEDPAPAFARLAEVSSEVRTVVPTATWISAGMSGDLEHAVRHGATHLRIGSAITGPRPVPR